METFIVGNDTFLGKYVIAIGNREIINENVLSRVSRTVQPSESLMRQFRKLREMMLRRSWVPVPSDGHPLQRLNRHVPAIVEK